MLELRVEGMTCGHCEQAITRAVKAIDLSARVIIDRTNDRVAVESAADQLAILRAITAEGYAPQREA